MTLRRDGRRLALRVLLACAALCVPACSGPGSAGAGSNPVSPTSRDPGEATGAGGALEPVRYVGPALPLAQPTDGSPPIDLVTPDGVRLALRNLTARTVVQGPLAFTELHLTFNNPQPRQVEGRFRIALPTGAAISRFAMRIGTRWQEGEVVEKQRAVQAYEDFLHRRQDPALLERAAGNEFAARVFPIAAHDDKELVLSYSQQLVGRRATFVPMQGLRELELVDVSATRDGETALLGGYRKAAFRPGEDFGIELGPTGTTDGLRSGELVVARIEPPVAATPDPLTSAIVLVDTSASRALGLRAELELVRALAKHVATRGGKEAPFVVGGFDQTTTPVFAGRAGELDVAALESLSARGALGASDLDRALRWAAKAAQESGARRVVLVGDGVPTAGSREVGPLRGAVASLRAAGVARLDAVAVGGIRDDELLTGLVTGGLARDGVVLANETGPVSLARLDAATTSNLAVNVRGARWSWPTELDGVQPGDEVLVYAELPTGAPLELEVGGKTLPAPALVPVARPLLERSWAQAKIASLLAEGADGVGRIELRQQIVALSTKHRVLSPYTSLLVLETEWDYQRFQIDRNALADILTIDGGQLRHLRRPTLDPSKPPTDGVMPEPARPALAAPTAGNREGGTGTRARGEEGSMAGATPPSPALAPLSNDPADARGSMWGDAVGDSFGAGGLGLSGIGEGGGARGEGGGGRGEGIGLGEVGTIGRGAGAGQGSGQGFGSGHGRLAGSHRAEAPQIRMGSSQVSGRLPPEVIQRVVRQRFGSLRSCYEQGLARNRALMGRIVVRFAIDRSGHVVTADASRSDLADDAVVACVVAQFRGLTFPAPEGGIVTVVYPIAFAPEGAELPAPRATDAADGLPPPKPAAPPIDGPLSEVLVAIGEQRVGDALAKATAWHVKDPGDVLGLVALGRAYEAARQPEQAARAYGSIIDLYPWRADQRRFAGGHLERLGTPAGLELALDSYRVAQEQRPDHPSSHRMLAMAWLAKGEPAKAFDVLLSALGRRYPDGRFAGVERVLREDLGLAAAAWIKAEPKRADEILGRLEAAGGELDTRASIRFVLSWETDANDVDLHVYDAVGGHAYYGDKSLASGGELYADVTTGYGPECFAVPSPSKDRTPSYRLKVQYYAQGPMGYGMGKVQIVRHDGRGGLVFEERPFVIMNGGSETDLGAVSI